MYLLSYVLWQLRCLFEFFWNTSNMIQILIFSQNSDRILYMYFCHKCTFLYLKDECSEVKLALKQNRGEYLGYIWWSFVLFPALHVSQPYRAVGKEGEVPLRCSFTSTLKPEEMQVSLYKGLHGPERICSAYVNLSEPSFTTNGTINCRGNISSGRVDMIVAGLRGNDTDFYRCEIEILFPPPYLRRVGNGTVVYIQGKR